MRIFWPVVLLVSGFGVAQSTERVEVVSRGQSYPAYLTVPGGAGRKPAVVLPHSVRGRQPGYERVADKLAADGFVVLALEWQTYETEPPLAVMDALLRDSLAFLGERGDVDPERVGLTGFCIGGYYAIYYLPTIREFAAGVAWYGFPNRGEAGQRPSDEAVVSQLEAPTLIFHGTADEASPISDIYEYATVLDAAGKFFELTGYQGEPHSFLVDGGLQNTFAANDAYEQMVAFFRRTLAE